MNHIDKRQMTTAGLNKQEVKLLQSCTSRVASKPALGWVHFSTFGLAYSTDGHKAAAVPINELETSFNLKGSELASGANAGVDSYTGYPENVNLLFNQPDSTIYQVGKPKLLVDAIFAVLGLPYVKLSLTSKGVNVSHGISDRWLDQPMLGTNIDTNIDTDIVLCMEHLKPLKLLKGFDSFSYKKGNPIIFRSNDTGYQLLMMPVF